jgi:hypothetical protein
LGSLATKQD